MVGAAEPSWSCAGSGGGGVGGAGVESGSGWSSLRSCSGPLRYRQYSGLPGAAAAAAAMEEIISSSLSSSSICTAAVESGCAVRYWVQCCAVLPAQYAPSSRSSRGAENWLRRSSGPVLKETAWGAFLFAWALFFASGCQLLWR
eukprot:6460458-Amphidinium_carterae.2